MTNSDTITRADIAALIGKSVNFVRTREKDMKLDICRVSPVYKRPILYTKTDVINALGSLGLILRAAGSRHPIAHTMPTEEKKPE